MSADISCYSPCPGGHASTCRYVRHSSSVKPRVTVRRCPPSPRWRCGSRSGRRRDPHRRLKITHRAQGRTGQGVPDEDGTCPTGARLARAGGIERHGLEAIIVRRKRPGDRPSTVSYAQPLAP